MIYCIILYSPFHLVEWVSYRVSPLYFFPKYLIPRCYLKWSQFRWYIVSYLISHSIWRNEYNTGFLSSVQFNSVQFSSIKFSSVQFRPVQFSSALDNTFTLTYHYSFQFNSVQFSSDQFSSYQFNSVQFNSVLFNSVQFSCFMPKRTGPTCIIYVCFIGSL